jgi:D-alanyl-D-alanine carboxypeptidase (penicillin-binding protein 5/6)
MGHSYAVTDIQTNTILDAIAPKDPRPQASLTKLDALRLIFDDIKHGRITKNTYIPIPTIVKDFKDVANLNMNGVGFRYALPPETAQTYSVDDLLKAAGGFSDGYAITALVQLCMHDCDNPQKAFINRMNDARTALQISSTTHYKNATGLPDDGHYSTAYDTTLILKSLFDNHFGLSNKYLGQPQYSLSGISRSFNNTCDLLASMPNLLFAKTGFTNDAGHCLAGVVQSSNGPIAIAVMNTQDKKEREELFYSLATQHSQRHRLSARVN